MKIISSQLNAHLSQATTTIATLWKVKRADGVILGFTDHDHDVLYDAGDGDGPVNYVAAHGFTPTAQETGSDLGVDNLEVTAFIDVSAITDTDLRAGLYDFCTIEIRLVNYTDLTQGDLKLRTGTIGNVKVQNGVGNFEVRGLMYRCGLAIGKLYGPTCRAELGDSECTVNLTAYEQNGSVNSVTDHRTFVPNAGLLMIGSTTPTTPAPPGWFSQGLLTWLTGANAGFSMEIATWDGTSIELFENMQNVIAPSDTFTLSPGCNLTIGPNGCGRFNNIVNFRGEPFIPGPDQLMIYPNSDGSVPA